MVSKPFQLPHIGVNEDLDIGLRQKCFREYVEADFDEGLLVVGRDIIPVL